MVLKLKIASGAQKQVMLCITQGCLIATVIGQHAYNILLNTLCVVLSHGKNCKM